jgi:nucleoside-diphosphate-sugar epimerase
LIASLAQQLAAGEVERVGDGRYRLQPIGVGDAAAAILAGVADSGPRHSVLDLVGPEAVGFGELVERVKRALPRAPGATRSREISVEEAERRASAGGYQGMLRDELDCLLCDEVADPAPLRALLGRPLTTVEGALRRALEAALAAPRVPQ